MFVAGFSPLNANGLAVAVRWRFPVKLQVLLIRAEMLDNPLTAKCFIYDGCALHEQRTPTSKLYKYFKNTNFI
jgi:hypothetical protein